MCDFCKNHPHPHPMVKLSFGDWEIGCHEGMNGIFVAWAAKGKLTCDNAVTEPLEPVYFNFGKTAPEAVARLREEVAIAEKDASILS